MEILNDRKYWKNLEFTSSPTKNGKYIPLDDNPSGNSKKGFLRKYLRTDSKKKRKDKLRLKTLTKINNQTYNEPRLIVTNDKHFGNGINKPKLCVAYTEDNKKRIKVFQYVKEQQNLLLLITM